MTDDKIVQVAAEAMRHDMARYGWPSSGTSLGNWELHTGTFDTFAQVAVAAVEPLIRDQIAQEIRADLVRADDGTLNAFAMGEQHAAHIARGDQQ